MKELQAILNKLKIYQYSDTLTVGQFIMILEEAYNDLALEEHDDAMREQLIEEVQQERLNSNM